MAEPLADRVADWIWPEDVLRREREMCAGIEAAREQAEEERAAMQRLFPVQQAAGPCGRAECERRCRFAPRAHCEAAVQAMEAARVGRVARG